MKRSLLDELVYICMAIGIAAAFFLAAYYLLMWIA